MTYVLVLDSAAPVSMKPGCMICCMACLLVTLSQWITKDLPMFTPSDDFFLKDASKQRVRGHHVSCSTPAPVGAADGVSSYCLATGYPLSVRHDINHCGVSFRWRSQFHCDGARQEAIHYQPSVTVQVCVGHTRSLFISHHLLSACVLTWDFPGSAVYHTTHPSTCVPPAPAASCTC